MPDGTETDLIEHLRAEHKKGTAGYTDEYLATLHGKLHGPRREPLPEHDHDHDHPELELPLPRAPVD
jgi:hypothetical protein